MHRWQGFRSGSLLQEGQGSGSRGPDLHVGEAHRVGLVRPLRVRSGVLGEVGLGDKRGGGVVGVGGEGDLERRLDAALQKCVHAWMSVHACAGGPTLV